MILKQLSLFAFVCLLSLVGCKKDTTTASGFADEWKLTAIEMKNGKAVTSDGVDDDIVYDIKMQGKDISASINLTSDGKYTSMGMYTAAYEYYEQGDLAFAIDIPVAAFATNGTWKRTGTQFDVTDSAGAMSTSQIVNETADAFEMHQVVNQTSVNQGLIQTLTGTIIFKLVRK